MKNSHHKVSLTEWREKARGYQIQSLAAELARIASGSLRYGQDDKIVRAAYERFFELVDLTLQDPKWKEEKRMLFVLRDSAATGYVGENDPSVLANGLQHLLSAIAMI